VNRVGAERVVPIHTEHPEMFGAFRKGRGWKLEVPARGRPIPLPT